MPPVNALQKYHPQWVYHKPAGVQEEPFEIPFSFDILADGSVVPNLPIPIDDEDIIVRGIFFNRAQGSVGNGIGPVVDAFFKARLRDTFGNPVSDDLTLMLGGWANPWNAACGFPIDPEIRLASGGVVLMDVAISSLL